MSNDTKLISNLTRSTVLCERASVADRPLRRMRGLLGRRALSAGEGLLLRPAPSVHTVGMRFAIDVVFLDRELRVVKVVDRLRPWRTAGCRQARSALELAAGEANSRKVGVGDQLAASDPRAVSIETSHQTGEGEGESVGSALWPHRSIEAAGPRHKRAS